jgi:hypothetical protein
MIKVKQLFDNLAGQNLSELDFIQACRRLVGFNNLLLEIKAETDASSNFMPCQQSRTRTGAFPCRPVGTPYRICDTASNDDIKRVCNNGIIRARESR